MKRTRLLRALASAMALVVALAHSSPLCAQVQEYDVKAAFLYNFALFTTAPKPAGGAMSYDVCIFGRDPFGASLNTLQGRTIDQRPVRVRHVHQPDALKGCQLVFIGDANAVERIAASLEGQPVITVAEARDFPVRGLVFNLVLEEQKVAFEVNDQGARKNQLDISSKLLRLAKNTH